MAQSTPAPIAEKMCRTCLTSKPVGEFSPRRDGYGGGYASACRPCASAAKRDRYWADPGRRGAKRKEHWSAEEPPAAPDGQKWCARCSECRPLEEFARRRERASGRASWCKPCMRAYNRERYRSVPGFREAENARSRRFRAENPEYFVEWIDENRDLMRELWRGVSGRRRARKRGLPTENYTLAQLIERDGAFCVLCSRRLNMSVRRPHPLSATVEHLECLSWPESAGDVLANVAPSHLVCNIRRKDRPHPAAAAKRAELLAAGGATP